MDFKILISVCEVHYILCTLPKSTVTAARILEQKCGGVNYLIEDDNVIRVYDTDIDLSRTNQEFITVFPAPLRPGSP